MRNRAQRRPQKNRIGISPVLGGGVQAAPFSPLSISGLVLGLYGSGAFFQASDGTTAATANNDPVAYWTDSSGNSRHPIQATDADRPLLKTAYSNSQDFLLFDGSSDTLVKTSFPATRGTWLGRVKSVTGGDYFTHAGAGNTGWRITNPDGSTKLSLIFCGVASYAFDGLSNAATNDVLMACTIPADGGDAKGYQRLFGGTTETQTKTVGNLSGTPNKVEIGSSQVLGASFWNGAARHMLLYDSVLSDANIELLFDWMEEN